MKRAVNPGGRPRKYANEAEKAAAYRERWASRTFRMDPEMAKTVSRLADTWDVSESVALHSLLSFALLNRSWFTVGLFGKLLDGGTGVQGKRRRSKLLESDSEQE